MRTTLFAFPFFYLAWFGLFGSVACGGKTSSDTHSSNHSTGGNSPKGRAGAGGQHRSSAASTALSGGSSTGTTDMPQPPVCPVEQNALMQIESKDCHIESRVIDPTTTCGGSNCAIKKALDLTCTVNPEIPALAPTRDGALMYVATKYSDRNEMFPKLVTISEMENPIEDVRSLSLNNSLEPSNNLGDSRITVNAKGETWLFAGGTNGVIAAYESAQGWTHSMVVPPLDHDRESILTDATVVDNALGYLTYVPGGEWTPHLVTWDGSCWTDLLIGESNVNSVTVKTDAQKLPWVAWLSTASDLKISLFLRHPNGTIQNLFTNAAEESHVVNDRLRLLPGGINGTAVLPTIAGMFQNGITLFSAENAPKSGWSKQTLSDTATLPGIAGDCPNIPASYEDIDHCGGMTTCTLQYRGVGHSFDLVRTQSGAVFVVWVMYTSEGIYSLKEDSEYGEMPRSFCQLTETSGDGTAELIVARITESEPRISRFRFVLGGAVKNPSSEISLAARGDTLLVAAHLNGDNVPTITYLEIDSSQLP
jgi:hypothetical protein